MSSRSFIPMAALGVGATIQRCQWLNCMWERYIDQTNIFHITTRTCTYNIIYIIYIYMYINITLHITVLSFISLVIQTEPPFQSPPPPTPTTPPAVWVTHGWPVLAPPRGTPWASVPAVVRERRGPEPRPRGPGVRETRRRSLKQVGAV